MIIFRLHGQYAYQMKALSILNSYLLSKTTIMYKKNFENWISEYFVEIFKGIKIRSQIFLRMILNTKKGFTFLTPSRMQWQAVKVTLGRFHPPQPPRPD